MNVGKSAAAKEAANLIKDHMTLGLGTGSTAAFFIRELGEKKLQLKAIATSEASKKLAETCTIRLIDAATIKSLDLTIDGADEVDSQFRLIKGGGGALLREKIAAKMAKEMVVIVDESKCVDFLGKHPLPVEVLPFGKEATLTHIQALGLLADFRKQPDNSLFVTDNGNHIIDIQGLYPLKEPEKLDAKLKSIPGVLETGLFLNLASRVIVGYGTGKVEVKKK